jgi:hypothetical protein
MTGYFLRFTAFPSFFRKSEHEAYLPTVGCPSQTHTWFPGSHENTWWSCCHPRTPCQRSRPPWCLRDCVALAQLRAQDFGQFSDCQAGRVAAPPKTDFTRYQAITAFWSFVARPRRSDADKSQSQGLRALGCGGSQEALEACSRSKPGQAVHS